MKKLIVLIIVVICLIATISYGQRIISRVTLEVTISGITLEHAQEIRDKLLYEYPIITKCVIKEVSTFNTPIPLSPKH